MRDLLTKIALRSDEELMTWLDSNYRNAAITELHKRYGNKSLGFFIRMLNGDTDRAQDLNQDLFLRILERHKMFNPSFSFYTWLFTIARNMVFTELKKKKKEIRANDELPMMALQEGDYDKTVFRKQLTSSLNNLSIDHRMAFELRFIQGLSVKEIAAIVEVPEGTIKSRLYHATNKVSMELKEFYPLNDKLFKLS